MKPIAILIVTAFIITGGTFFASLPLNAQGNLGVNDTAMSRMRPIGAPSAIDRYPQNGQSAQSGGFQWRQTVRMPQSGMPGPSAPALPPSSSMALPSGSFTQPPTNPAYASPLPQQSATSPNPAPQNLPQQNLSSQNLPRGPIVESSPSDLVPLHQPSLQPNFATMSNSNCITGPSDYSVVDCGVCSPVSYMAPVAQPVYVAGPPVTSVVAGPPAIQAVSAAPVPSLFTLGQEQNLVSVGQGLWGQPVAYVPGQGIRNWLRYFSP